MTIDVTLRCFSRARWIVVATNRGVYDAQENVQPGFAVDEIGQIELSPGNLDTWFWVNLRIHGPQGDADVDTLYPGETDTGFKFTKSKFVKFVRDQATPVNLTYKGQTIRTYQFGATTNRIQLIDPRDYAVIRCREWLGGMEY